MTCKKKNSKGRKRPKAPRPTAGGDGSESGEPLPGPLDPLAAEFCNILDDLKNNNKPLLSMIKEVVSEEDTEDNFMNTVKEVEPKKDTNIYVKAVETEEAQPKYGPDAANDSSVEGNEKVVKENSYKEEKVGERGERKASIVDVVSNEDSEGDLDTKSKELDSIIHDVKESIVTDISKRENGHENKAKAQNHQSVLATRNPAVILREALEHAAPEAPRPVKHPLEHRWTFWHLSPDKSLSWTEKQQEVMSVETVEDFWAVFNWILPPSRLRPNSDYSLFKTGVRPDWEVGAST
jgi:hypothetical protein